MKEGLGICLFGVLACVVFFELLHLPVPTLSFASPWVHSTAVAADLHIFLAQMARAPLGAVTFFVRITPAHTRLARSEQPNSFAGTDFCILDGAFTDLLSLFFFCWMAIWACVLALFFFSHCHAESWELEWATFYCIWVSSV